MSLSNGRFVVIGGGIAGVSCVETLHAYLPHAHVSIVSGSPLVKTVRNLQKISATLSSFDVQEMAIADYLKDNPLIKVYQDDVKHIDYIDKKLLTENNDEIQFDKLCVCTGATPKVIFPENKYVLGIRDTNTVEELDAKLKSAERIVIVGNGGIATELVFQISSCDVVWAIKDNAIGQVFFDPGAAEFFLPFLKESSECESKTVIDAKTTIKRMNYKLDSSCSSKQNSSVTGNALGPDWHQSLELKGNFSREKVINVEYNCEVKELHSNNNNCQKNESMKYSNVKSNGDAWPVYVELTNGQYIGCDFIVSATGVTPNVRIFENLSCTYGSDGGIEVDENMRVLGLDDIYAAGDVCSTSTWKPAPHWLQMRLWSQARQMGMFAAQCMVSHYKHASQNNTYDSVPLDICFSLFAHVTNFFGKKVCLLGCYNGQGIDKDNMELLVRITPKLEYIKVILVNGRMHGAVLVGETDLEETFENLILNETDLRFLGEDLLNPGIDIADYFD